MKYFSNLKEFFSEDESDSWRKINKILSYTVAVNTVIFICLSFAMVLKSKINVENNKPISCMTSEQVDVIFNIGGRLFNLSRQTLENNKQCKLYFYYQSQISSSEIWIPRNPELFDIIYEYLVKGFINTKDLNSINPFDILEESRFFKLPELTAIIHTYAKPKLKENKQKPLIKLVRNANIKMGKLKNIEIIFENGRNVFHPGDPVCGNVIIESKGEVKINALKIFMRGMAKVHWTETKTVGYKIGNYTEHFRSEIEYISFKKTLIGRKEGSRDQSKESFICDGYHVFPFQFLLPREGLVTSFEGKHGSIRYYLKVELDKPWAFNHKLKKIFTVIKPVDINQSEYLVPMLNECSKTICCWMCRSGPVSINVNTDRRGYCPGESIALSALFENNGNRTILPTASLYQIQTYNASGKHFISSNKLVSISGSSILAGESAEWSLKPLRIPAVSPSITSVLIRVEYFVKISLLIPGSYSLSCILPIVVGTVPFRQHVNSSVCCSYIPSESNRIRNDAPPSYSELKNLNGNNDEDPNTNFFPLYAYVNDYQPPPYSMTDFSKNKNQPSNESNQSLL